MPVRSPSGRRFVNAKPDSGVFGSMKGLTAEQASAEPSPGGRSIAAHFEHLRWSLETVNQTLRGEPWEPDWSASWTVQTVDDSQWQSLQAALRKEFAELKKQQGEVSKIERRKDVKLSTLRDYVRSIGGTLQVLARMPDGAVRAIELEDERSETPPTRSIAAGQ